MWAAVLRLQSRSVMNTTLNRRTVVNTHSFEEAARVSLSTSQSTSNELKLMEVELRNIKLCNQELIFQANLVT